MNKLLPLNGITLVPISIGITIAIFNWIFSTYFLAQSPNWIFNLAGLLNIPGAIIVIILTSIFTPKYGWQAMHLSEPFAYFGYLADFLFYSGLSYIILRQLRKYKYKTQQIRE